MSMGKPRQPDLLGDVAAARRWIREVSSNTDMSYGATLKKLNLDARGLRALRELRESLITVLTTSDHDVSELPREAQSLEIQLGDDGIVRLVPYGNDWRAIAARVLIEAHVAQVSGTWRRLKVCRNERCRATFFDRSKNNSGVWHDVRGCGNAANLRASRARRRALEQPV